MAYILSKFVHWDDFHRNINVFLSVQPLDRNFGPGPKHFDRNVPAQTVKQGKSCPANTYQERISESILECLEIALTRIPGGPSFPRIPVAPGRPVIPGRPVVPLLPKFPTSPWKNIKMWRAILGKITATSSIYINFICLLVCHHVQEHVSYAICIFFLKFLLQNLVRMYTINCTDRCNGCIKELSCDARSTLRELASKL